MIIKEAKIRMFKKSVHLSRSVSKSRTKIYYHKIFFDFLVRIRLFFCVFFKCFFNLICVDFYVIFYLLLTLLFQIFFIIYLLIY